MGANEIPNAIHFQVSFGTGSENYVVGSKVGVETVLRGPGVGEYEIVLEQKVSQDLATLESMLNIQATPVIFNAFPPTLVSCDILPNGNVRMLRVDAAGVPIDPEGAYQVIGFRYPT